MVKYFKFLIEDGDLFKEDEIGKEINRPFMAETTRNKLRGIKEVYRKFRLCLKGEAGDTWLNLVEDQKILVVDEYTVDNHICSSKFRNKSK